MAWEGGWKQVQVEIDNSTVLTMVMKAARNPSRHENLLQGIRDLISKPWTIKVGHVHREANHSADYLASKARTMPWGYHHFVQPP